MTDEQSRMLAEVTRDRDRYWAMARDLEVRVGHLEHQLHAAREGLEAARAALARSIAVLSA